MKKSGSHFYLWVVGAIVLGGLIGHFFPEFGVKLKPLGDGFIALIKMLIGPIIFLTVVLGIAGVADVKKVGRVGVKAILYFEVVSTIALVIGLVVVNTLKPGAGFNADPAKLDPALVAKATDYAHKAEQQSTVDFLLHIIPKTFTDAFTGDGSLLQVLLLAVLFGFSLLHMGKTGEKVMDLLEPLSKVFFGIMSMIMKLAPIGAGAAMAFTIGEFGFRALGPPMKLLGSFYLTCLLFVFVVLNIIARLTGFSLVKLLRYIAHELWLVLGTSSSESALPTLMAKLEHMGARKDIVGIVVPSGYSFNLDGTSIYLTMAAIFIAQALGIELSLKEELTLLAVLLLASKGAAGVTGSGFVTLAATLATIPTIPVAGIALILGVDRFMSEARALTNLVGNSVATIVVAKWEGALDMQRLHAELDQPTVIEEEPFLPDDGLLQPVPADK